MKSKNRIRAYRGIAGLALVLAVCLVVFKSGDGEKKIKIQTAAAPTPRESVATTKKLAQPVLQEGSQKVTLRFKVGSLGGE